MNSDPTFYVRFLAFHLQSSESICLRSFNLESATSRWFFILFYFYQFSYLETSCNIICSISDIIVRMFMCADLARVRLITWTNVSAMTDKKKQVVAWTMLTNLFSPLYMSFPLRLPIKLWCITYFLTSMFSVFEIISEISKSCSMH